MGLGSYLATGHFVEAVFENWESEFLQMFGYVVLTVFLVQKGSPESKPVDEDKNSSSPSPGGRRGPRRRIYEHSLSLVLLGLFLLSFALHAAGGAAEYSQEQMEHGQPGVSMARYVTTARFWFESLQNWQSEFLAVGSLVLLSVYLRERGSPESHPVDTPIGEKES